MCIPYWYQNVNILNLIKRYTSYRALSIKLNKNIVNFLNTLDPISQSVKNFATTLITYFFFFSYFDIITCTWNYIQHSFKTFIVCINYLHEIVFNNTKNCTLCCWCLFFIWVGHEYISEYTSTLCTQKMILLRNSKVRSLYFEVTMTTVFTFYYYLLYYNENYSHITNCWQCNDLVALCQ